MAKKVLIISSSPRKNANSHILCEQFAKGAEESGNQVKLISLREKKISYCTDCGACHTYGKPCPIKDDVNSIVDDMIAADVIVLATPVYFYTMSAQLKTLIDRTCARYEQITDKEMYFIATAAETDERLMDRTFDSMRGYLDCLEGSEEKGCIYGAGAWQAGEITKNQAVMKQAYEAGKNV